MKKNAIISLGLGVMLAVASSSATARVGGGLASEIHWPGGATRPWPPVALPPHNYFKCDVVPNSCPPGVLCFAMDQCRLQASEISAAPTYAGQRYEAELTVNYSYHFTTFNEGYKKPRIVLCTNGEYGCSQPLQEGDNQTIRINSKNPLVLRDSNPQLTEELRPAMGQTHFFINSISLLPSAWQVASWVEQARVQADAIEDGYQIYTLTKDYFEVVAYMVSKRAILREAIANQRAETVGLLEGLYSLLPACGDTSCQEELSGQIDDLENKKRDLEQLIATIDTAAVNQPIPITPQLQRGVEYASQQSWNKLQTRVDKGRLMLDRLRYFQQSIVQELQDAIDRVNS